MAKRKVGDKKKPLRKVRGKVRVYKVRVEGETQRAKVSGWDDMLTVISDSPDVIQRAMKKRGRRVFHIHQGEECEIMLSRGRG